MGITVSRKEFADILGNTPPWVGKLIKEGMPVKGGGGRGKTVEIDTADAIQWLIEREIRKRVGDDEDASAADEDRLLKRARRKTIEFDLDKKRGFHAPIPDIEAIMFPIATVFASQLDALAASICQEVAAESDPADVLKIIHAATRKARADTAGEILALVPRFLSALDEQYLADDRENRECATGEEPV